uniref:Nicotinic acetylcholine receptor beta 1 subunit n=1 Tax=Panagrolaimus sp. ES5 TaxID=591445 RepID=A0AC34G363_9BILA
MPKWVHTTFLTVMPKLLCMKRPKQKQVRPVQSTTKQTRNGTMTLPGYNSLIQPVKNLNDTPIVVRMALQLVLLINVDEKDQIMHTNVWLTLKWKDFQMAWNPTNYGNIKEIRVSPDKVWLPDIVLFNNADGNYEVSFMCNVVINHRGDMLWVPPAIYKSSCIIDVEFFPFDEQTCHLIFGSWTYNENEIKLEFEQAEWMDLSEYAPSSIWDVMDAPASLVNKRSRIEFQLRIRRKTLFYTVVLIIPTVLMAFLSMAVFFLPTDSGEKMTLTISVLLSIVIFGSWTYNENEIKLEFEQAEWMDLSEYAPSSIWDVMDAPASLVNKRSRIEFQLRIRRKTLFYTVVLIIPTVLMAFLSMAVFFLPTDSGEKMTLTISVLLSIVVFLLLVSKILPPTSSTIPLMAKYLLLTFVLNVITIMVTVIVINVYFRGPTTHRMPKWVHTTFLTVMPKLLCMKRPKQKQVRPVQSTTKQTRNGTMTLPGVGDFSVNPAHHHPLCPSSEHPK